MPMPTLPSPPGAHEQALLLALSKLRSTLCAEIATVEELLASPAPPDAALRASLGSILAPHPGLEPVQDGRGAEEQCRFEQDPTSRVEQDPTSDPRPQATSAEAPGAAFDPTKDTSEIVFTLPQEFDDVNGRDDDAGQGEGPLPTEISTTSSGQRGGSESIEDSIGDIGGTITTALTRSISMASTLSADSLRRKEVASDISRRRQSEAGFGGRNNEPCALRWLINHRFFEISCLVAITSSSIIAAAEVQYKSNHMDGQVPPFFVAANYFYNFFFAAELLIRLWADGCRTFFLDPESRAWNILDTLVVAMGMFEVSTDLYILSGGDGAEDFKSASNVRVMRSIRSFRAVGKFRAFRLIHAMSHLNSLIVSVLATLQTLGWASALMSCVIFCFAVSFTECALSGLMTVNNDEAIMLLEYWGSLGQSMDTLFQSVANGLSWKEPYDVLCLASPLFGKLFLGYLVFAQFVLLNVITGVFCNAAIDSSHKDPELVAFAILEDDATYQSNLVKLFTAVDTSRTGEVTLLEFKRLIDNRLMRAQFQALGLDIHGVWTLFKLMDTDQDGLITEDEFVAGCKALKGGAKSVDVNAMRVECMHANRKVLGKLEKIEGFMSDCPGRVKSGMVEPLASSTPVLDTDT